MIIDLGIICSLMGLALTAWLALRPKEDPPTVSRRFKRGGEKLSAQLWLSDSMRSDERHVAIDDFNRNIDRCAEGWEEIA